MLDRREIDVVPVAVDRIARESQPVEPAVHRRVGGAEVPDGPAELNRLPARGQPGMRDGRAAQVGEVELTRGGDRDVQQVLSVGAVAAQPQHDGVVGPRFCDVQPDDGRVRWVRVHGDGLARGVADLEDGGERARARQDYPSQDRLAVRHATQAEVVLVDVAHRGHDCPCHRPHFVGAAEREADAVRPTRAVVRVLRVRLELDSPGQVDAELVRASRSRPGVLQHDGVVHARGWDLVVADEGVVTGATGAVGPEVGEVGRIQPHHGVQVAVGRVDTQRDPVPGLRAEAPVIRVAPLCT